MTVYYRYGCYPSHNNDGRNNGIKVVHMNNLGYNKVVSTSDYLHVYNNHIMTCFCSVGTVGINLKILFSLKYKRPPPTPPPTPPPPPPNKLIICAKLVLLTTDFTGTRDESAH